MWKGKEIQISHCFWHKQGCVSSVRSHQSSLSGTKLMTGRFSYNSSHWQQVNKLTQIQDTELGLLFSTQAPSSNSTRMWFNTSMQWPSSPKPTCWRKRSCAACRQFPSFLCTGWLQSTLRYIHKFHLFYPKTDLLLEPPLKSKTWYSSQVTKDLVGKPHGILTFLAKYYLYFGF